MSVHYDRGEDNKCERYFVAPETHREAAVNACLVDNFVNMHILIRFDD